MDPDDRADRSDLIARLLSIAETARTRGVAASSLAGEQVDAAVRALVERRVRQAIAADRSTTSARDVAEALDPSGTGLAQRLGRAGAGRVARRAARARTFAVRTPAGLAIRYGPAVVGGLHADLRGLDAAIRYLVDRARRARIQPRPDRVAAVVVQALAGLPVDPGAPADHRALAVRWLENLGRRLSPIGSGPGGRSAEVVAALTDLDVRHLR